MGRDGGSGIWWTYQRVTTPVQGQVAAQLESIEPASFVSKLIIVDHHSDVLLRQSGLYSRDPRSASGPEDDAEQGDQKQGAS